MRKDDLGLIGIILFVLFLVFSSMWWSWYKFMDCKKVGHSTLYCVGKFFSED